VYKLRQPEDVVDKISYRKACLRYKQLKKYKEDEEREVKKQLKSNKV
jgi:hypothetical protein